MYLTPTPEHWACDIEADNLLDKATTIWCATVENCVTGETASFTNASSFVAWLTDHPASILVGHNFLAYDLVMLNRFWNAGIGISRVVDTYILSQLYDPSLPRPKGLKGKKQSHSLEAWGLRLKCEKGNFDDFSKLTPEMLEYCAQDTRLTALLFRKLSARMRQYHFSEEGCEIEHLAWHIIQNKQRRNGFPFDVKKAEGLYVELRARQEQLEREIHKLWPPELLVVKEFAKADRKDGSPSADFLRHTEQYPKLEKLESGGYRAYDWVSFNLASPPQRLAKLLTLGWVPTKFTKKTAKGGGGTPQVDEDELLAFAETSGTPELVALAKWLVVSSRANMIRTWLDAVNPETGAIHGKLFLASTLRYKHSNPNSANIPAVRTKKGKEGEDVILFGEEGAYAYECRDLFFAGDDLDFVLVGIDATGIQNRCLIHWLIDTVGEELVAPFRDLALEGDIHKHNISVLGLANKAAAKKFYYTLMMGGGGGRLAADQAQFGTRMTEAEGTAKKKKLVATIPGFGELIKRKQKELAETGRIRLIDGTPILVPSPHMVIPYLLQGDESRLMKRAMWYTDQEVRKNRLTDHVFKVADIHDEWQFKVRRKYVEKFVAATLPSFPRAGDSFSYLIPISGDAKVGDSWAKTH